MENKFFVRLRRMEENDREALETIMKQQEEIQVQISKLMEEMMARKKESKNVTLGNQGNNPTNTISSSRARRQLPQGTQYIGASPIIHFILTIKLTKV